MTRWAVLVALLVAGCTASSSGGSPTPSVAPSSSPTSAVSSSPTSSVAPTVATGPTTTASATRCPFVTQAFVRDAIGMRLGRLTVQRSSGRVVGCRLYALQGSALSRSEHLPGPTQPVVEIVRTRYTSAASARTSLTSLIGSAPETTGSISCFRTAFYPPDAGKDWACAFVHDTEVVLVRTVVTSPALNALRVTQQVRSGL